MVPIDRFMLGMGSIGKRRGLGIVEKQRDIVIQGCMIFLQRQDIIGPLIGNALAMSF